MLQVFRENQLKLNLKKCEFGKEKVYFLGHIVSSNGISVDERKIEVIRSWALPKNVSELRSFLGLANYYRKFVNNYSETAACLMELLKKEKKFVMGEQEAVAFESIKVKLCSAPVLMVFDSDLEVVVETDASDFGMGAVLQQVTKDGMKPVAFESKKFNSAKINYPVHEKELFAIVMALKTWRCYLEGIKFKVISQSI